MIDQHILDEPEHINDQSASILENVNWWERRRLLFNIIIIICGIIPFLDHLEIFQEVETILFVLFYGLVLNVLFSLGWIIDILGKIYFNHRFNAIYIRLNLMIIGIFLAACITTYFSIILARTYYF